jgi:hypothetical protein
MSSTQLISAESYDTSRMIFSDPQVGSIPNSKPAISFSRINISTKNDDGTTGELIISTEELYSFGVSENKDMETGRVNGYVMPLCLYNRNGPSEKEKAFVKTFTDIVEKCKDYLIDNKEELGQYELERNDLKKLNPLYYKRDKGKIVEGASPMLYAKLIVSKKQDKTITVFFDRDTGDNIDALDLLGKYCYARAAIKIESIFIGNKISLQVKLYECEVKRTEFGMKRLLSRPQGESRVLNHVPTKSNPLPLSMDAEDDDDDAGSLVDMAEKEPEPVEETIKPVPKKIIKKVIKKKE